ncbi:MAG: hypothetical protein GC208_10540 [Alphaproteobacteria bacterium]|nr:hypothetical protein [Alphaproteobacteria bacterium]
MSVELSPMEAFQKYAALGPDFLTWLLMRVLDDDYPKPHSEPGLKIDIQGPLLFISEDGEARKVALAGDEVASAPEVMNTLRQGKKLIRAKIIFTAQEDSWGFTLDAQFFDLKSIKLPVPSIPDLNQYLQMRIEATMRLYSLVDEMFTDLFLPLRLDPEAWKEETGSWKRS